MKRTKIGGIHPLRRNYKYFTYRQNWNRPLGDTYKNHVDVVNKLQKRD
jgi:hypothetical protein